MNVRSKAEPYFLVYVQANEAYKYNRERGKDDAGIVLVDLAVVALENQRYRDLEGDQIPRFSRSVFCLD